MKGFVSIMDNDCFAFLSQQPVIDEVNFWEPGGRSQFKSLHSGEPFLFKLHKHGGLSIMETLTPWILLIGD